jgi:hypothetical protein
MDLKKLKIGQSVIMTITAKAATELRHGLPKKLWLELLEHYNSMAKIYKYADTDLEEQFKKEHMFIIQTIKEFDNTASYQHGFDLTGFDNEEDWLKVLKSVGITETKPKEEGTTWVWKGKNITIYTASDPITGKGLGSLAENGPQIGYASYIGLEGDKETVMKAVSMIKKYGDYKDESAGTRDFI